MASITLVRTVSFSIYQRSKYVYCDWVKENFGVDVMGHVSSKGSYPNLWSVATFGAAGATAGSCITLIACKSASPGTCSTNGETGDSRAVAISQYRRGMGAGRGSRRREKIE